MAYPFVVTGSSIVITVKGTPVTVQNTAPNYIPLREAIRSGDWDEVEKHLSSSSSIDAWSRGNFQIKGNEIFFKGEKVPTQLANRMFKMASNGESPEPLFKFWEKLQRNPSWRSVEQLFPFLEHQGIPIQPNGNFLAYKGVKNNYTDAHTGMVDNKPGAEPKMPRNKISDDPDLPCHYGYHVGALSYARSFSQVTVVCEVDPEDVVCIPKDESQQKMRVCRYKVIGNHNGEYLPSTTYELEDIGGDGGSEIEPETDEEEIEIEEGELDNSAVEEDIARAKSEEEILKKVRATLKPKQKQLKVRRPENKQVKLKVPREFQKLHRMDHRDLMHEQIGELRTYAAKVLHIVGASKIPGGKAMLVKQILKVRKNFA